MLFYPACKALMMFCTVSIDVFNTYQTLRVTDTNAARRKVCDNSSFSGQAMVDVSCESSAGRRFTRKINQYYVLRETFIFLMTSAAT